MTDSGRLTTADLVSLSRVLLAGAFLMTAGTVARLVLIAVAGFTDYLDGHLARRGGASGYGAVIDPAADRVFVVAIVATLVVENVLSIAQCLVLMARDIVTTVGVVVVRVAPRWRPARLEARRSGKVVTALQFVTLIAIIIEPSSLVWLMPVVARASAIAIADYSLAVWRGRVAA